MQQTPVFKHAEGPAIVLSMRRGRGIKDKKKNAQKYQCRTRYARKRSGEDIFEVDNTGKSDRDADFGVDLGLPSGNDDEWTHMKRRLLMKRVEGMSHEQLASIVKAIADHLYFASGRVDCYQPDFSWNSETIDEVHSVLVDNKVFLGN